MQKLITCHCNTQEYMGDVEVRAAHNVLEACAQTETIDKVIFTSSATAVVWREDRKTMELDLDERHWSDVNFCRKFKVRTHNNTNFVIKLLLFTCEIEEIPIYF